MNKRKLFPLIGLSVLVSACTGAFEPTNPNVPFISGKWKQFAGPDSSRLALNIGSDKAEIYLDCMQSDGNLLRSVNSFPIQVSLDQSKMQIKEGVKLYTQGPSDDCDSSLPAGTYEAFLVRGLKMHLIRTDDWSFVGAFERASKTEFERDENTTTAHSRIQALDE